MTDTAPRDSALLGTGELMAGPARPKPFALVVGGGTAGHVQPALAVAGAIARRRGADQVELVGSKRGLDATMMPESGFAFTLLPGRGISRKLTPAAARANAGALWGLSVAMVKSLRLVVDRRPSVVVAVGGYASVPPALAAWITGVPVVVLTVDAVPGAANRLLGRLAKANAVAFAGSLFRSAVFTGAPVRPAVLEAARGGDALRSRARDELGLPQDATVIAAFGGSLGATTINRAIAEMADGFEAATIYHVVGRRDFGAPWLAPVKPPNSIQPNSIQPNYIQPNYIQPNYIQVEYEQRMDLLYMAADLAVCRAGAMTVAELAATGLPSILIPLPGAPGDHQTANARALVDAGAAVLLEDDRCTASRLRVEIEALMADPDRLPTMRRAAASLAAPDAAEAIASVAEVYSKARHG